MREAVLCPIAVSSHVMTVNGLSNAAFFHGQSADHCNYTARSGCCHNVLCVVCD